MQSTDKILENRVRREAKRRGYLLRRSRLHDESQGLYLLIGDSGGNRKAGAQAPISAFARGEGDTLEAVAEGLRHL